MSESHRELSMPRAVLQWLGAILAGVAATVVGAWLIGRFTSDRWTWSQWLLWVPTPAAVLATGLGLLAAMRPGPRRLSPPVARRRRLLFWLVVAGSIGAYFLFVEHRFARLVGGDAASGGVSIVCWNMDHNSSDHVPQLLDTLVELDGDITIAVGGGGVPLQPEVWNGLRAVQQPVVIGPFTVISRARILEYRHLVASDGIAAAMVRLDCADQLGRDLSMMLVNLPSDPRRSRWHAAEKLRTMLDAAAAPKPDIIVGDFNTTRNSSAMRYLFPEFSHAFDVAGRGYGASFPRELPLYHIDHVLLAETAKAISYELIDPQYGRHLVQRARIMLDRTR
jgi:hypothetical protein